MARPQRQKPNVPILTRLVFDKIHGNAAFDRSSQACGIPIR